MSEEFLQAMKELGLTAQKIGLMSKEYLTLDEVAFVLDLKRSSLYYYLNALQIKRHRFKLNRHTYIAKADVMRIMKVKAVPWTAPPNGGNKEVA